MAALTRTAIAVTGTNLFGALAAAAGGGDTYTPQTGREIVAIRNADATSTTVTVQVFDTVAGLARPNRTFIVPAGELWLAPLLALYGDPANAGRISFTYSKVTSLTVGVIDQ